MVAIDEMNLLNLLSSWLDDIYQIQTKVLQCQCPKKNWNQKRPYWRMQETKRKSGRSQLMAFGKPGHTPSWWGRVCLTRHDPWRGTRQQLLVLHATWQLYSLPCMAGYSSFAPPCMVAELNGLVLKYFWTRIKFEICFEFRLKIKKNRPGGQLHAAGTYHPQQPRVRAVIFKDGREARSETYRGNRMIRLDFSYGSIIT